MTTEDTGAEAPTDATSAEETDEATTAVSATSTPRVGTHSMLTRDSDVASRPGFRNPANKRSKVQSGAKKPKLKIRRKKGKKKR